MMSNFFSINTFLLALGIFILGAFGSLVFKNDDKKANFWGHICALVGSIVGVFFSLSALLSQSTLTFTIPTTLPLIHISFYVDQLSAFFCLIISLVGVASSIFGIGYMDKFYGKYNLGVFGFFYNIFILSLFLVVTSYNAIHFLFAWEIMSLASFFLVIFEYKKLENTRSGFLYLIMMHIGTACIALALMLMYKATGSFDFAIMQAQAPNISAMAKNIIFVFALIGFGTKAGIIPLHIWLPLAHPSAPAHVSALMSGVMIKTSVFMLIRIFFDILGGQFSMPLWWGMVIMLIGASSSFLGVLYALTEHDIKRLLAYHSIENIGIIFIALGSAFILYSMGFRSLAMVGMIAALFHTINHSLFKALLFLGAGSVIFQTHTSNIEEYGGLIKRMPYTAIFFLIGSMAISGLPPLNGFASEWMAFQALFSGVQNGTMVAQAFFILGISSLAFSGGLAAACFVKVFGSTFLARPRSVHAGEAKESSIFFTSAMGILALLCILFGIGAAQVAPGITNVLQGISAFSGEIPAILSLENNLVVGEGFSAFSPFILFTLMVFVFLTVFFAVRIFSRKQKVVLGRTWDCGEDLTQNTEITSTSFSRSLVVIFKGILRPTKQVDIEYHDSQIRYFTKSKTITLAVYNIYDSFLYRPLHQGIMWFSEKVKRIQSGNVNAYIFYILAVLITLLIWSTR